MSTLPRMVSSTPLGYVKPENLSEAQKLTIYLDWAYDGVNNVDNMDQNDPLVMQHQRHCADRYYDCLGALMSIGGFHILLSREEFNQKYRRV